MKKNFFTFLALLAMVCSSVDAQTTETVTISATVGARTYVSSNDLDFSSFNKNAAENGGVYDLNLTPYYVSGYNKDKGEFKLTRFSDDQVPAYTPMILLGKQHNTGVFPSDVKSFDVPITTIDGSVANPEKRKVWANNYAWLVPAMKTTYNRSICLLDASGNEDLDEDGYQIMSNVVFFDNTGITENARLALNQTENVQVGVTKDTTVVKTYFPMKQIDGSLRNGIVGEEGFYGNEIDDFHGDGVGSLYVLWTPYVSKKKPAAYGLFKLTYDSSDSEDAYFWEFQRRLYVSDEMEDIRFGYDTEENKWISSIDQIITSTPITENYTQYFLGANGITPVFKKCNNKTGSNRNGVNYGGAYVRVWSALVGGSAAAREDMSFEIFDEDGMEISYQNDEVTGIRSLQNTVDAKKENRQIYNLQGQKLDKMKSGLNIVNGKKYFVK